VKKLQINKILTSLLTALILAFTALTVEAQPDPGRAMLKSLIVPGWGHYYTDNENWVRGQVHLASDAILIISWAGFSKRASNLRDQSFTLANLKAGIDLDGSDRTFRLAIGDFRDLEAYNEHHRRNRNWHRLIEERPENMWSWENENSRREYRDLRETSDRTSQQIPAIVSLMVVNRVVSGLSAYIRARNTSNFPAVRIEPIPLPGNMGYRASLLIRF